MLALSWPQTPGVESPSLLLEGEPIRVEHDRPDAVFSITVYLTVWESADDQGCTSDRCPGAVAERLLFVGKR